MPKKSKKKDEPVTFQIEPQTPQPVEFIVQQPQPQPEIPMAQPAEKSKGPEFQCPECGKIFIVALTKRPAHIKCPYCGLEGIVE
jgi:DNA-directed RNA polymerase subunit RPC12/RpoP